MAKLAVAPTFAPPKVAVLTDVRASDALSAHWTSWLSDQLSVRSYFHHHGPLGGGVMRVNVLQLVDKIGQTGGHEDSPLVDKIG